MWAIRALAAAISPMPPATRAMRSCVLDAKTNPHTARTCPGSANRSSPSFGPAKNILTLERHGARTLAGIRESIAQRLLALAACIVLNHQLGRPKPCPGRLGRLSPWNQSLGGRASPHGDESGTTVGKHVLDKRCRISRNLGHPCGAGSARLQELTTLEGCRVLIGRRATLIQLRESLTDRIQGERDRATVVVDLHLGESDISEHVPECRGVVTTPVAYARVRGAEARRVAWRRHQEHAARRKLAGPVFERSPVVFDVLKDLECTDQICAECVAQRIGAPRDDGPTERRDAHGRSARSGFVHFDRRVPIPLGEQLRESSNPATHFQHLGRGVGGKPARYGIPAEPSADGQRVRWAGHRTKDTNFGGTRCTLHAWARARCPRSSGRACVRPGLRTGRQAAAFARAANAVYHVGPGSLPRHATVVAPHHSRWDHAVRVRCPLRGERVS